MKTPLGLPKYITALALTFVLHTAMHAQTKSINAYAQQLFLNVYTSQPDTSIAPFLRDHIPSLYDKNRLTTGNTSTDKNTGSRIEIHTFVFDKHPYFVTGFVNGKLEFYCRHFSDSRGEQVFDVKLWFEFENQLEAEMAFSKLVERFLPISQGKRFSSTNGAQRAEFSGTEQEPGFNKVQFRLTADNLDRHRFKILFETGNEL